MKAIQDRDFGLETKDAAPTPPRYEDLPDLVTPEDARAFLQVSRNKMYDLLRTNAIRSLRFGRLIRIPKAALMGEESSR